jgi:hypothetical protein
MRSSIRMWHAHEPLRSTVPKGLAHCHISPPPGVAPAHSGYHGGACSSSSSNSSFLKMLWGIFAMCHHTGQHMDVMERCLDIVHCNQDIIHSQRDEPLIEFLDEDIIHSQRDEPVYPLVPDPCTLLTPVELAAFGICPSHAPTGSDNDDDDDDDDDEEKAANNDEETEDDE